MDFITTTTCYPISIGHPILSIGYTPFYQLEPPNEACHSTPLTSRQPRCSLCPNGNLPIPQRTECSTITRSLIATWRRPPRLSSKICHLCPPMIVSEFPSRRQRLLSPPRFSHESSTSPHWTAPSKRLARRCMPFSSSLEPFTTIQSHISTHTHF